MSRDVTPIRERAYAFQAFDELAAYAPASLTRAQAITEARDADWRLVDDYRRVDLRAVRVHMRPIGGEEATEFFDGEYDSGLLECHKDDPGAEPWWKVEPR
jgi:hypothetical protein